MDALASLSTVLVFILLLPANGFPVVLATADWKRDAVGKSMLALAVSFAVLVDAQIAFIVFHIKPSVYAYAIQVGVFLAIDFARWWVFIVAIKMRFRKKTKVSEVLGDGEKVQ